MNSIESIFPLKTTVSWETLTKANNHSIHNCVGALTLKEALGEFANGRFVAWGYSNGMIDKTAITTVEEVNMVLIKEPMEVTFILKK